MEKKAIITKAESLLSTISSDKFTYNPENNFYLSTGYTSLANNTYLKAARISERLLVVYSIGIGFCRTFLNAIDIYLSNGKESALIAHKAWGGCNYRFFNEGMAHNESICMLKDALMGQAKLLGQSVSESELQEASRCLIDEVEHQTSKRMLL